MALRWYATAPIFFSSIRSFNRGDLVPNSIVEAQDLDSKGLVTVIDVPAESPSVVLRPLMTSDRDTDAERENFIPSRLSEASLREAFVPFWLAGETVTSGTVRMSPDGQTIERNTDGTTGASFNAAEAAAWTVTSGTTITSGETSTEGIASTARAGGPIIGFGGDSHTGSAGATDATYGFVNVSSIYAGGFTISKASIEAGVGGNTSGELLSRFDADVIDAGAQTIFVLIGTNDADPAAGVSLSSYQENVRALKAKADAAGLPIAFGTIPPRGPSATAAMQRNTTAINLWLRSWTANNGVPLADIWSAVVDRSTGRLAAAYNSGDDTHLNNAGHAVMAKVVAEALSQIVEAPPWPVQAKGVGMLPSPLQDVDDSLTFGGSASYSFVENTDGTLPAGRWLRITASATTGGGAAWTIPTTGIGWGPGDKLAMFMYARGDRVGSLRSVVVLDQTNSYLATPVSAPPTASPGPIAFSFTVPTPAPTTLKLGVIVASPGGTSGIVDVGACDVFNLTRMGIDLPI